MGEHGDNMMVDNTGSSHGFHGFQSWGATLTLFCRVLSDDVFHPFLVLFFWSQILNGQHNHQGGSWDINHPRYWSRFWRSSSKNPGKDKDKVLMTIVAKKVILAKMVNLTKMGRP